MGEFAFATTGYCGLFSLGKHDVTRQLAQVTGPESVPCISEGKKILEKKRVASFTLRQSLQQGQSIGRSW